MPKVSIQVSKMTTDDIEDWMLDNGAWISERKIIRDMKLDGSVLEYVTRSDVSELSLGMQLKFMHILVQKAKDDECIEYNDPADDY